MGFDLSEIYRLGAGAQRQIAEQLTEKARATVEQKQRKFHNVPTQRSTPEGGTIRFDSQKEARRFDELMLKLRAGEITDLRLQQHYTLSEAFVTPAGERVPAIHYVADFVYRTRQGETVVEDVKGGKATQTPVYRQKKVLMQNRFGITIKEV